MRLLLIPTYLQYMFMSYPLDETYIDKNHSFHELDNFSQNGY